MSIFSKLKEVVLASPMEGVLTHEGKPVSDVKIIRKLRWYDGKESMEDSVFTTNSGHFNLPAVKKTVKISGLVQFVTVQQIFAIYKGEEIELWTTGNLSTTEYGELCGKPVNFRCELTDEEERFSPNYFSIYTRFRWDDIKPV